MSIARTRVPLMDLQSVACFLNASSEYQILKMIDDGELLWTFDIRGTGGKAVLRVLTWSVHCFQNRIEQDSDFNAVADMIFPAHFLFFPLRDAARRLCCCRNHVNRLVMAGDLRATGPKVGLKGELKIERGSLVQFLKKRRMA
jgi:hypothetical protein